LISVYSCWVAIFRAISLLPNTSPCVGWLFGYHDGRLLHFRTRPRAATMPSVSDAHQDDFETDGKVFRAMGHRPLLAIITSPNSCETHDSMEASFEAIRQAVQTQYVDLVSIRLSSSDDEGDGENESWRQRAVTLTKRLVELSIGPTTTTTLSSLPTFKVVCSSDMVSVAVEANAHGVHVKERHLPILGDIVEQFDYPIIIGTSTHSLHSHPNQIIQPHYYFVGTCYMTASHPEKSSPFDLEGPQLPGKFKKVLGRRSKSIPIFAIGGIDDSNCHEPLAFGADGVAVIRAVVEADDPGKAVIRLQEKMREGFARGQGNSLMF
jgi:thiamine-phosphate diphosphorylase